jgi:hypothetical protein
MVSGQLRAEANMANPGCMGWIEIAITAFVVAVLLIVFYFLASYCFYKKQKGNFMI